MTLAALGVAAPGARAIRSSSSNSSRTGAAATTTPKPRLVSLARVCGLPARSMTPLTTTSASTLTTHRRPGASLAARATGDNDGRGPSTSSSSPPAAPADNAPPRTSVYNTEFGYTRKDIFLLGFGLIGLGYVMYYGLQAFGMDAGMAGNWVQLTIFLGICVGYVSTYVYRVATKQMTYVKQLEQYEEAVMRRRLEEMTEAEVSQMVDEADAERAAREARRAAAAAAAAAAGPKDGAKP